MTIPNIITVGGIVSIIIYVVAYIKDNVILAATMLLLIILSDALDGFLARRLNQASRLGAFLDPLRDRLLFIAILGNLISLKGVKFIINLEMAIIIAAEIGIATTALIIYAKSGIQIKVHLIGKLRQFGHIIFMGIIISGAYYKEIINPKIAFQSMAILSFATLVFYIGRALKTPANKPLAHLK